MISDREIKTVIDRHKFVHKLLTDDPAIRDIHRLYQLLDGKSAALFTHVSIMVAVSTVLAATPSTTPLLKNIFLVATFLYLIIAVDLLRVLNFSMYDKNLPLPDAQTFFNMPGPENPYSTESDEYYHQTRVRFARSVYKRGRAHKRSLLLTILLTIAMLTFIAFEMTINHPQVQQLVTQYL